MIVEVSQFKPRSFPSYLRGIIGKCTTGTWWHCGIYTKMQKEHQDVAQKWLIPHDLVSDVLNLHVPAVKTPFQRTMVPTNVMECEGGQSTSDGLAYKKGFNPEQHRHDDWGHRLILVIIGALGAIAHHYVGKTPMQRHPEHT